MKTRKGSIIILLTALLSLGLSTSIFAAKERTPIKEVHLTIHSTIESGNGGTVTATADGNEYSVSDVEILNDEDNWSGGMRPRVTVTLYAQSGYYFYSSSKSMFSFSGEDVTYVTSKRDSDKSELTVTLLLSKLDNGDLSVSGMEWDEGSATAMWDENPSAKYYHVRLYRDGKAVTSSTTTHENYYEFAGNITRRGDYYFEVRAVGSGSEKGDWESSDSWYVTSNEADDFSYNYVPSSGGPNASGNQGNWNTTGGPGAAGNPGIGSWCLDQYGWWYRNADNSYTRNNWQVIDGLYYYFNESGYMRTGWISWNNKWYYCGPDGALWSNTRTPDGFFVGGDGVWVP